MMKTKPVDNIELYWSTAPREPSPRLLEWVERIKAGWKPNKRIRKLGYHASAEFYGVYIWEWRFVLFPLLGGRLNL